MGRNLRPWWLALAVSLLLHTLLIGGLRAPLLNRSVSDQRLVYDVRLAPVPIPAAAPLRPTAPPPPAVAAAAPDPVETPPPASPVAEAEAVAEATAPVLSVPVEAAESPIPPAEASVAPPAPIEAPVASERTAPEPSPAPPALNTLPSRIDLRYKLAYGIASGAQTLTWVRESATRYTVVTVAEATGLAGLFYRGKFVQTSRGRITPSGLEPEEFWDQRGDKRSSAQFDQGRLTLHPARGAPRHFEYAGAVQDVLSLFFQLALTAPPPQGELGYTVFNGKKLRDYRYVVRGETQLDTALGPLRTLHLARVSEGDGRFEVWLAIDRYYLPVRIVKSDDNDNAVELSLLSMTP